MIMHELLSIATIVKIIATTFLSEYIAIDDYESSMQYVQYALDWIHQSTHGCYIRHSKHYIMTDSHRVAQWW